MINPSNSDAPAKAHQDWWYVLQDARLGPVRREELVSLHVNNVLALDHLVWTEEMGAWLPLGEVKELSADLLEALRSSKGRVPPPVPRKSVVGKSAATAGESQEERSQAKPFSVAEKTLFESHPKMFASHPIAFVFCIILIAFFGLGLLIFLIWWMHVLGTTLTLTNQRITLRKGILSKEVNEVYHTDVRNVRISQSPLNRIFGVGTVAVQSAALGSTQLVVNGIPGPEKVRTIIDHHRRQVS